MNIKKILSIVLATILSAAVFAACGGRNNNSPGGGLDSELISAGKIVIGISPDYPPYEDINPATGEVEGFDIDMMSELAKHMAAAGNSVEVDYKFMDFDTIISAVQLGQVDVGVSAFTWSADREGQVLFSTPYLVSEQVAVVGADSGITSLDELADKRIGVQLGTTGESAAREEFPSANFSSMNDYSLIFASLGNGAIDAVIADGPVARGFAEANGFVILEPALIDEENHIIIKNGNEAVLAAFNAAIEKFVASDEYMQLQIKWGISGE